jgi:C1A family cysteine protease
MAEKSFNINGYFNKIISLSILLILAFFSAQKNIFCFESKFKYDFSQEKYNFNLPSKYDSRDKDIVTSVKKQFTRGSCWAFSVISTLETNYLSQTNSKKKINFSEKHLIDNMNLNDKIISFDLKTSGNHEMASAYFSSGRGPVIKSYDNNDDIFKSADKFIRNIIYLPDVKIFDEENIKNHRELIKYFVHTYGAVASNFYWDLNYLDKTQKNYFYNGAHETTNHSASIIGWDDNYSRKNFKYCPDYDGAFILKNSWGDKILDSGFFYMSYQDYFAGYESCLFDNIIDSSDKFYFKNIYQYDYFGMLDSFDLNILKNNNFFCVKYGLKDNHIAASDIAFFIASPNTKIKIWFAKIDNNKIIEISDLILEKKIKYPGFYCVELEKKFLIFDKNIYLVFKLNAEDLKIPCEGQIYDFSSKVDINENNYVFNNNDFILKKLKDFNISANLNIKLFVQKNLDNAQKINFKKINNNNNKNNDKIDDYIDKDKNYNKNNINLSFLFSVLCIIILITFLIFLFIIF